MSGAARSGMKSASMPTYAPTASTGTSVMEPSPASLPWQKSIAHRKQTLCVRSDHRDEAGSQQACTRWRPWPPWHLPEDEYDSQSGGPGPMKTQSHREDIPSVRQALALRLTGGPGPVSHRRHYTAIETRRRLDAIFSHEGPGPQEECRSGLSPGLRAPFVISGTQPGPPSVCAPAPGLSNIFKIVSSLHVRRCPWP